MLEVRDGVVVVANPEAREPVVLPADAAAYSRAASGRYTLRSTGEVVVDPDYLTTWTVMVGGSTEPLDVSAMPVANGDGGGDAAQEQAMPPGEEPRLRSWFAEGEGGWFNDADR